ncbi:hypothetical protein H3N56_11310 [Cetobacterium sp. 2A]|uniref:hypothetical protein n=1 Tax=Cetobacterium sp. 2A TaxID=2754723 RepID=UPI00163D0C0B|nr:hypothetical protein [Cetobacterium sp. 2A]MBC2857020.1 hypothetical protein [Cetobacterium sp. 2A]
MKKLLILVTCFSKLALGLTVYDPANHQQNMRNYQMMILQKIEQVKTASENALQTRQQLEQLKNDTTNLEGWTGLILGEESQNLVKGMDDLNAINKNSKSILRDPGKIDLNFDDLYKEVKNLKGMNSEELSREIYKLSSNRKNNLKDNLKTATKVIELNEQDTRSMAKFMNQTDGASGNLQSAMATKKGIDQLNGKFARLTDLQAKAIMMEAEKQAEEQAKDDILNEKVRRMLEMSPETKKLAEEMRRSGKMW